MPSEPFTLVPAFNPLEQEGSRGVSTARSARRRELFLDLASAFHPEVRLAFVSTGSATTVYVAVEHSSGPRRLMESFDPADCDAAALEGGAFQRLVGGFSRLEKAHLIKPSQSVLGGLRFSARLVVGGRARDVHSMVDDGAAGRAIVRNALVLAWSACVCPRVRKALVGLAGYVDLVLGEDAAPEEDLGKSGAMSERWSQFEQLV